MYGPEQRGNRWLVNQRYYRYRVETDTIFEDNEQWRKEIDAREEWAEQQLSHTRRRNKGKLINSVYDESDWSILVDYEAIWHLWWYFMNENDALLYKLRWG
jgi:hypothetical protein